MTYKSMHLSRSRVSKVGPNLSSTQDELVKRRSDVNRDDKTGTTAGKEETTLSTSKRMCN